MEQMDDWVGSLFCFDICLAILAYFHVEIGCTDSSEGGRDVGPRLLDHVREKVPVFVGQNTNAHVVFGGGAQSTHRDDSRRENNKDISCKFASPVDNHGDRDEECELEVKFDQVGPEEAAVVWSLEIRVHV